MMKNGKITVTTTLPETLYRLVCTEADERQIPKNQIIEEAILLHQRAEIEKAVAQGFDAERVADYKKTAADFCEAQAVSFFRHE